MASFGGKGESSMRPWAMLELTTRGVVRRKRRELHEALGHVGAHDARRRSGEEGPEYG